VSPAIFQTSTYRWDHVQDGLELSSQEAPTEFYARWGHPNGRQMETIVAALEGTQSALATSSGAAAMTLALMAWVGPGDHVVLARTIYGETRNLVSRILGRFGVRHTIVDSPDSAAYESAIEPATRVVVTETPANPTLDCVDIAALAKLAHAHGARLIVDSTFATPVNTRPAALGADAVVHSATKYLPGHSDVVAGVLATDSEAISRAWDYLRITGPVLGPFDAWLVTRGLRTLELRMARPRLRERGGPARGCRTGAGRLIQDNHKRRQARAASERSRPRQEACCQSRGSQVLSAHTMSPA
jgi:methionine-gamma-lyase